MPCMDGLVIVKSSDKTWSTGGGNGKSLQRSCRESTINIMKRPQNNSTPITNTKKKKKKDEEEDQNEGLSTLSHLETHARLQGMRH